MSKLGAYLRDRTGLGTSAATMAGGASFAYVFGWVLVFLLLVEGVTGAALAAFYSPSTTSAWASVAYIQDQASWGWLIRGLHHHGGGALAIVSGLHLVQTAVFGAYKKPRELTWWVGLGLMGLILAWAVTGYVLRWDQAGYWANKVEVGIAAGTPIIGDKIRSLALGGNDYGNLTLTRFYMLHVIALPALVALGVIGHIVLARRHGTTPRKPSTTMLPRWPDQTLRNALAMALVLAALLGYVVSTHGVELAAPADPSQSFDARPLWYFRWLYELRVLAGSFEKVAALLAPAVVGGILVALPIFDRGEDNSLRARRKYIGTALGLLGIIGLLTLSSFVRDCNDERADGLKQAAERATLARQLAVANGVPATGALDVFATRPMWKARTLFETRCKSCHSDGKDRLGPIITLGHGDRAWLAAFLKAPSSEPYWGHTKLKKDAAAMAPVELSAAELDDLVEWLDSQAGFDAKPSPAIVAKRASGQAIFDKACDSCHSRYEGVSGASGPNLFGLGTREYYLSFVSNPKSGLHMADDKSEMPRFDKELSLADRDGLAEYLVWLRTATPQSLGALGAL